MAKNQILVKFLGDNKNLSKTIKGSEDELGGFAKKAGALGATAVAAGGAGLVALGTSLADANRTIAIGTGATGAALQGLSADFKAVASSVPASFGDAATAVADLNTRTGLTGPALQGLSAQMIDLSRITKTDLGSNIKDMTRLFGDAGLAPEQFAGALDKVFAASQATGIGVDKLAQSSVQFGAPLRQLGFGFDDSLALLSKFEKEGVNVETVLAGMKSGLGKLAKAGEEPTEAFARITDEIANATTAGEANRLAIETFGQRAGPDLAAAIREGRVEIGDLVDSLGNVEGKIADTTSQTDDWREQLKVLRNRGLLKLGPAAATAFAGIGQAVTAVTPFLEKVAGAIGGLGEHMNIVRPILIGVAAAIVAGLVPAFVGWAVAAGTAAAATIAAAAPFVAIGVAIAGVAAALVYAYENWEGFREVVDGVAQWMSNDLLPAITKAWNGIETVIATAIKAARAVIDTVTAAIAAIWQLHGAKILKFVETVWQSIRQVIGGALDIIRGVIQTVTGLIRGDWSDVWNGIKTTLDGIWSAITGIVDLGLATIKIQLELAWDTIKTAVRIAWNTVKSTISTAVDGIVTKVTNLPTRLLGLVGEMLDAGKALGSALLNGLKNALSSTAGFAGDVGRAVLDAVKGVVNRFVIDKINSALEFKIPVPFGPDISINPPNIPWLHSGGPVGRLNGPRREIPAILEQGEWVLSRGQVRDLIGSRDGRRFPAPAQRERSAAFMVGGRQLAAIMVDELDDYRRGAS